MVSMSKSTTTGTATKTKKPSVTIQANPPKSGLPPSSPASATKRLPGSAQTQTTPVTNGVTTNGAGRASRRAPRVTIRTGAADNMPVEKKATIPPEPYVITSKFILKKHKDKPPSLIVHLHPAFWRFDQQEGSFSYQSEMRPFLEHLQKGTIPHDYLEEFRKEGVRFYDGCLIVRVVDHKKFVATDTIGSNKTGDEDKPFSIHNHNQFITPSPDQSPSKTDRPGSASDKENVEPELKKEPLPEVPLRLTNRQPIEFLQVLRPTGLSRNMDLMLDFIAPDPKAKKLQKAGQPPTPGGTVPPTPINERPPPLKKQKTRIDPQDQLVYEARIVNATAGPLYLEPATDLEHIEQIYKMLTDPLCNELPSSPKSRKRTFAELAADDAHAKEQERFMLIMDGKGSGTTAANASTLDSQAGLAPFQPRFERFNALDSIKRELNEKKQRENEKRLQDDELRRSQQQQQQEEETKRRNQQAAIEHKKQQAIQRQQQHQMQMQQRQDAMAGQQPQQSVAPAPQRRNNPNQVQPNAIPPNMHNQIMPPGSSPVIRQGTPHAASSPLAGPRPMMRNGSQTGGAGSPPRPGSSLQHGHPVAAGMMRQPSGQGGPSRNGTPQIPAGTPATMIATPVIRQGTPAHPMTHASPVNLNAMAMNTPQMAQATMQGQMPNGMHPNMNQQAQMAAIRRQQMQSAAMQQQMNGQPMNPQMVATLAQQQAQLERHAAMQQRQAAMQGTPQPQHISPTPTQTQNYQAQVRKAMMQQMGGSQGSPAPNQMSPQAIQQMQMQMQMQMQAQQTQAMQNQQGQQPQQGQARPQMNPQMQQLLQNYTMTFFKQAITLEAQKYGGNPGMIPGQVKHQLQQNAQKMALQHLGKMRQHQAQQQQQQQQQQGQQMQNGMTNGQQGGQMVNGNIQMAGNMNPNMAAQQFQNQAAFMQQQQRLQNAQAQMQQNYQHQLTQHMNQQQGPR
ncbi:hypothetical protein LTR64_008301 [Lithohypha guttulata]|uniref:uncharacterized protein n=1 Tax=Lithohypha guttulata TaxID=1690604 RepID=UPI002DDF1261|nr:hypothetical protein LTR51_008453 [Lithohypha guttulata]